MSLTRWSEKNRLNTRKIALETETVTPITQCRTTTKTKINSKRAERKSTTVYSHSETCKKTNHSTGKNNFAAHAANKPLHGNRIPEGQNQVKQRDNQNSSTESAQDLAKN